MIRINLIPEDELISPYWMVPDVVVLLLAIGLGILGVQYYFTGIQDEINVTTGKATDLEGSAAQLEPEVVRFKNLKTDITSLEQKVHALESITKSKIDKYKPVIVLEHLQNLKPEGTWFQSLRLGVAGDDIIEIKASALDNILAAEFITAIRATESQDPDEGDLRTLVYFSDLKLEQSVLAPSGSGTFPDLPPFWEFNLTGVVQEKGDRGTRKVPEVPAPGKAPPKPVGLGPVRNDELKI